MYAPTFVRTTSHDSGTDACTEHTGQEPMLAKHTGTGQELMYSMY
jgi:hypothetical protein